MQGALTGWFSRPCFLYQLKGEVIMVKTYVHSIRDRPDPDKNSMLHMVKTEIYIR